MQRTSFLLLAAALATPPAGAAGADPQAALTIYRSDGDVLFSSGTAPIDDGHAVAHERRTFTLQGGRQSLRIDGLPAMLDSEAVAIDFGDAARVLAQRVASPGDVGALAAHRGEAVQVMAADGALLAEGTLLVAEGELLGVQDADGRVAYVRNFARVVFPHGAGLPGSTLEVVVEGKSGTADAMLTYPTKGLGWRAAYSAQIAEGADCRMNLSALASIANRSGRAWSAAELKLVAGAPNLARSGYAPRAMMAKSMDAAAAPEAMPEQSALGDYRSYAIDGKLDLPDGSVTQVPLYPGEELACTRRWLFENGGTWFPPRPMLSRGADSAGGPVTSELLFKAAQNLPAGNLRVLVRDGDGRMELLGENHLGDTPKGSDVRVQLGTAFDLRGERERTGFQLDQAARTLDEAFRVTLTNSGGTARTVTVREHPDRWRDWTLQSSSRKPVRTSTDTLDFEVPVPAGGSATLDYAIRYRWTGETAPAG